MLHAKFQDHRTYGSGECFKGLTIYGHGGHLVHVTCTIYINFLSHSPRRLHMKFGIDWRSGSEMKMFKNNGYIHVYSPGTGADNPLRSNVFINSICQSI